jgi:hypothetical protein
MFHPVFGVAFCTITSLFVPDKQLVVVASAECYDRVASVMVTNINFAEIVEFLIFEIYRVFDPRSKL